MEDLDLEAIPIPSPTSAPSTSMQGNLQPDNDDFKKYWEQAQSNLQRMTPLTPSVQSFPPPPPNQFYSVQPSTYDFIPTYNPAMLGQMPAMYGHPNNVLSAANRLNAERRLREVMPKGAVIAPIRANNFGSNQRGGGINNRFPRPQQFQQRMTTPSVTVKANEGNFRYSDLFNRMVPENVQQYIDRSYDALPSDSMKPQLEFYLKERLTPLLDSGTASRVNFDAEPLPHKINFKVSEQWVPAAKMRGAAPLASGTNSVEVGPNRKRTFQSGNNFVRESSESNRSINGSKFTSSPLSKREKKKQKKQIKALDFELDRSGGGGQSNSSKVQKYLNKGIGFVKEGEIVEDAQRRQQRAMRFHDGASSSNSAQQARTTTGPLLPKNPVLSAAERIKKRQTGNKTDSDNVLSYFDRREIEQDLIRLEGTYCPTAAEKYQLLLKRDNFMNLLEKLKPKSKSGHLAARRVGTCPDMCPEKERYMRQVGNLVHAYECNSNGTLDHAAAVKDYTRSAADQDEPLPHELRPLFVLQNTMDYLILKSDKTMTRSELVSWYDFLWSRTRSIRKDITQQMLTNKQAVSLVEKCARFHTYASFCMANQDTKAFDARMNTENLSKCLQTLRHLYDDLAKKSVFCESEPEFRAYDILLNLADSSVMSVVHTYRRSVRESRFFKTAIQLACYFQADNFVAFFRLIRRRATFLQACLCRRVFGQIRSRAIHTILKCGKPPNLSVLKLTDILAFDNDQDTVAFMNALKLNVGVDGTINYGSGYQLFSTVSDERTYGCEVIEKKLDKSLSEVIAGGPCSVPTFPPPVNSFVMDYYIRPPRTNHRKV